MAKGSKELSKMFYWQNNAEPIRRFLKSPYHLPTFEKITMPTVIERARAVYLRGGKEAIIKRSAELINDILK
jgi:hypothetical protein